MLTRASITPVDAWCHAAVCFDDHGTGSLLREVEALARILLPQIQAFFESEEGLREFAEWKSKQNLAQDAIQ